jgi:hypothetical protein
MRCCAQRVLAALAGALTLGGCATLTHAPSHAEESSEQVSWVDEHSSYPSVRRRNFEQLNLIELIDPRGEARTKYAKAWDATHEYSDHDRTWGVRYDLSFAAFRESDATPDNKRIHRNSVQDRILGVATSRCNVFKTYLRRQQTEVNFRLGFAATAAGVLGAVMKGVNASRNLAGAAGLFSGTQAEYNQQYFSNLAAHLLIQGIELRQSRMLTSIVKERQSLSVADYSMEAAVKDAILFDGSCSAVTGLMEASESIKEVTNPGLPRAFEIMAGVRALHEMAHSDNFTELMDSGKLQKLHKQATPTSTPLIAVAVKPTPPAVQDKLATASKARARIDEAIGIKAGAVAKTFTDAQAKLDVAKRSATPTAAQIAEAFRTKVSSALATLPVAACVKGLDEPAAEVGKQTAIAALQPEASPERLQANEALDKARASATLAIGRVELLVDAGGTATNATADKWSAETRKEGFDKPKLDALEASAPRTGLTDICK